VLEAGRPGPGQAEARGVGLDGQGRGRPGWHDARAGEAVIEGITAVGIEVGVAGRDSQGGIVPAVVGRAVGVGERRRVGPRPGRRKAAARQTGVIAARRRAIAASRSADAGPGPVTVCGARGGCLAVGGRLPATIGARRATALAV
jgi:hypothetical protein